MTLAKSSSLTSSGSSSSSSSSSCRSKKDMPKKAVSFTESAKFQAPLLVCNTKQEAKETKIDDGGGDRDHLQATNKRRRYMRRGSKCPSMLLGMATFKSLLQDYSDNDDVIDTKECNHDKSKMMLRYQKATDSDAQQQARRLSLMSALKVSLESSCSVVASKTTTLQQLRKEMPRQERRMSTFQLLSSAVSEDDNNMMMITMGI